MPPRRANAKRPISKPDRRALRGGLDPHSRLERRELLATYTVTTTADAGAGSLRDAINTINQSQAPNEIDFLIPGAGLHTITPLSDLPAIFVPVLIDGYTQPGSRPNAQAQSDDAVLNIQIDGTAASTITGIPAIGLNLQAPGSTIRGLAINRFADSAITANSASGLVLSGNFLGTDPTGATALPGQNTGIVFLGVTGSTIGGATPADRNLISGNLAYGIDLAPSNGSLASASNVIAGNFVGTDATGTRALGNGTAGVFLDSARVITIGGTASGAGNVISGNAGSGVLLQGVNSINDRVLNNLIGTNAAGGGPLANLGDGVRIGPDASFNSVGGGVPGAGNTIAFNGGAGVAVIGSSSTGNAIASNSIFSNARLGIDLGGTGVPTQNTPGGPHVGPNNLQNYPVLLGASLSGATSATVSGTLNSTPFSQFLVEFFSSPSADPSGFGQGQRLLGSTTVLTDSITGDATFSAAISGVAFAPGTVFTATATLIDDGILRETSEFSAALDPFVVTNINDAGAGSLRQVILNVDGSSGLVPTVRFAIPGLGVQTITPASALPAITTSSFINGYTQPGSQPNSLLVGDNALLRIALNGSIAGTSASGITVMADDVTIRGLAIGGFGGDGIVASGHSGVVIAGDFLGTDASGTQPFGNAESGVLFTDTTNSTIGGGAAADRNIISGNGIRSFDGSGIAIQGAASTGNLLIGNLVGTDASGRSPLGNRGSGIVVSSGASSNTIGGVSPGSGNVISGNVQLILGGIRLGGHGVAIQSSASVDNQILGNFIGTDATGAAGLGNEGIGILVDAASRVTIGGVTAGARNVISENGLGGILVRSTNTLTAAASVTILGNLIGTDVTGTQALGNPNGGVILSLGAINNTIAGNVISGNGRIEADSPSDNVDLVGPGVRGNFVIGNKIGTDISGSRALGNPGRGIYLGNSDHNSIQGNVISGNRNEGLVLAGEGSFANLITGNLIGTDSSGSLAIPNGADGVLFNSTVELPTSGAFNNTLGGTTASALNIIAFNTGDGIGIAAESGSNIILGNYIGVLASGAAGANSGSGVNIANASGTTIGGTTSGAGNVIAFNGLAGVVIVGTSVTGNSILSNAIFGNTRLGIDLGGDGVPTTNTPGGPHVGPNHLQNYPVLASVTANAAAVTISGALNSTPGHRFRLEFFANPAADPSGFGQGQVLLGSVDVTTDTISGNATFSAAFPAADLAGQVVSATATDLTTFDTSEFSADLRAVRTAPTFTLTLLAAPDPVAVLDLLTYTFTATNIGTADATGVILTDHVPAGVFITAESAAALAGQGATIATDGAGGTIVTLAAKTVAVGASRSLVIQARPANPGTIVDSASVTYDGVEVPVVQTTTVSSRAILTFTVLNDGDEGFGSLRQAIRNADQQIASEGVAAPVTIDFKLPADQLVIRPTTPLPFVAGPIAIDASTQPGFAGSPLVTLDGSRQVAPANAEPGQFGPTDGLVVSSGGATIRGLVVQRFAGAGIVLLGGSGSRVAGTTLRGNGDTGIFLQASSDNTIGGLVAADRDVISLNGAAGVQIRAGSTNNLVLGSFLGTDATGTAAQGNGQAGVFIQDSRGNTIGGTAQGARNVISGNGEADVQIFNAGATGNLVAGNFIGPGADGAGRIGPVNALGVFVNDAPGNTIGGSTAAARNVISGHGAGVELFNPGASGNLVAGNYLGTDASGSRAIANTIGALAENAGNNTIGGAGGFGNVISGNAQIEVRLEGAGASRNVVLGNLVGLDATGAFVLDSAIDGLFLNGAPGNTIGPGNVVAGYSSAGIQINGVGASANMVVGNQVGVNASGVRAGRGLVGILVGDAPANTLGGINAGAGNLVVGNSLAGIEITGRGATGEVVQGNIVRGNGEFGIVADNAKGSTIPASGPGANVVSGSPIGFQVSVPFGPQVVNQSATGSAATISTVSLTFSEPLAIKRAIDVRAYRVDVLNARGKKVGGVAIASASYDSGTLTVTLTLAKAVPASGLYRITALGQGKHALRDTSGQLLDGAGRGASGTNYVGRFGAATASRVKARARHEALARRMAAGAKGAK